MWYFIWILEIFFACAFGIITALILEHVEIIKTDKEILIEEQQHKDY